MSDRQVLANQSRILRNQTKIIANQRKLDRGAPQPEDDPGQPEEDPRQSGEDTVTVISRRRSLREPYSAHAGQRTRNERRRDRDAGEERAALANTLLLWPRVSS